MKFQFNDGGRAAAGYKGNTGDCVCRAIAIAADLPYQEVYNRLAKGNGTQKKTKRGNKAGFTAAKGINVKRQWFRDYMAELGFEWVATMKIGQGCRVHLTDGELPMGRLVVAVSKHYTTVLDGVINDTYSPERETHTCRPNDSGELKHGEWINEGNNMICSIQRRCVYGYWIKK